jgi:hypothetical protein
MGSHFATHSLNADGSWKKTTKQKKIQRDISLQLAKMPRLLGLAQASKIYRQVKVLPIKTFQ